MPDLAPLLIEAGALARDLAAPMGAWTALALAVEAALRASRPSASVGLWARGATMALLPALLIVPSWLAPMVPAFRAAPALDVPVVGVPGNGVPAGLAPSAPALDVVGGLAVLAGVVSVVALVVLMGGVMWLMRYRRALRVADAPVRAGARALGRRLGVDRTVEAAVVGPTSAPFTLGWRRPLVGVPAGLSGEPLELALAHELAHVRRAHFGWHLAERAVCAAFVWHPMVHILARGLALDRERVADADVIGLWPDRAARYGRLLATFARHPTPGLALGASSSTLIPRLAAMARPRPDRPLLAALVGAALLAVPLGIAAAAVPDAAPAPSVAPAATAPADTVDTGLETTIAGVSSWIADGDRRIEIQMQAGTSMQEAVAVADRFSDGDTRGDLVVIAADGARITRSTLNLDALPPPPPPPPAPPAPPPPAPPAPPDAPDPPPAPPAPPALPSTHAADIEAVSVRRGDGARPRVEVRMKAGTSRQAAVTVADELSAGGTPGQLVVIAANGDRITRSTVSLDAPPPPPAPRAPRAPTPRLAPTPPAPPSAPTAPRLAPTPPAPRDSR